MGRKVRFGGPALPAGTSTWYDHRNPDGSYGGQLRVEPGAVVDEDRIGGTITTEFEDGSVEVRQGNTADYYVNSGRAQYVNEGDPQELDH